MEDLSQYLEDKVVTGRTIIGILDSMWSFKLHNLIFPGADQSPLFVTSLLAGFRFIIVVIITWTVNFDFVLMLEHDIRGNHT